VRQKSSLTSLSIPTSLTIAVAAACVVLAGCRRVPARTDTGRGAIVVTYAILGSLVKDLVGNRVDVVVTIPNGLDPHEWEPSAKDVEAVNKAALVVENGLGLEGGMEKTLAAARKSGVPFFTASDHVTVRRVQAGEGLPSGDPDQAAGAQDPHLWMDPLGMKLVVDALAKELQARFAMDVSARRDQIDSELTSLDADIRGMVAAIPQSNRRLVTGHESLGYFAQRYGFELVGAVIPSLSTQAEVSAAQLAALKRILVANPVRTVFTEQGTPKAVVDALANDLKVRTVPLMTHSLPPDVSYLTFLSALARTICESLR
jgi:zinc/manganese transport system substrate-binding protein